MEYTSVTDFQTYHNPRFSAQANDFPRQCASLEFHDERVASIEHENEDYREPSISSSTHHSSDDHDEAVFDSPSHISSPETSPQHSDDDISVLLSESGYPSVEHERSPSSPYTPVKTRSPFRNPSSVRAMQLDTTPPPHLISPSSQQRYKFTTPSRNGTPRSVRSHNGALRSSSRLSPTKKLKKEYPLVLLHVTLLPIAVSYSTECLESVLPGYILENWKLLQEKATDTVLQRGILIPHPKEDYDLLEERLLESLELKLPRILKCGHFHLEPEEEAELAELDAEHFDDDDEDNDTDICDDCGRRVRDGRYGSGTGNRRWDIKLYAANGLMRAGAWGAAWREMERVDVEILPWMDEDMKRELELRKEEEERQTLEQRQFQQHQETPLPSGVKSTGLDDERLREIYGEDAQAYVDGLANEDKTQASPPPKRRRSRTQRPRVDVPLWTLLLNYIYLAAQDRRNLAIGILSILVLFLSLGSLRRPTNALPPAYPMASHVGLAAGDDTLASQSPVAVMSIAPFPSISGFHTAGVDGSPQTPSAVPSPSGSASTHPITDAPPAANEDSSAGFAEALDEAHFEME